MTSQYISPLLLLTFCLLLAFHSIHASSVPKNQWYSLSQNLTEAASARFDAISFSGRNFPLGSSLDENNTAEQRQFTFFFSGVDSKWKIEPVLQAFDSKMQDWFLLDQKLSVLPGRRDGGALYVPPAEGKEYGSVVLFGGIGADKQYISTAVKVDLNEGTLEELGEFKRQRFSIMELDDAFLVLGGRCLKQQSAVETLLQDNQADEKKAAPQDDYCNDFIIIPRNSSLDMSTWERSSIYLPMQRREWTGVARTEYNTGIVFGGVNEDGAQNDLYRLHYKGGDRGHSNRREPKVTVEKLHNVVTGSIPSPRSGHNMMSFGDESVYVIGGEDANGRGMNNVWHLNGTSLHFTEISPESSSMRRFLGASVFRLDKGTFCIYGGVNGWVGDIEMSGDVNCMRVL